MATNSESFNVVFAVVFFVVIVLYVVFIVFYVERKRNFLNQEDLPIPEEIVESGKKHFKESKVLICGLARNISKNIGTVKKHLQKITSFFDENGDGSTSYKILIVENNSSDTSRTDLLNLKPFFDDSDDVGGEERLIILCPGKVEGGGEKCDFDIKTICDTDNRIMKMVILRNVYMKYIKQNFKKDEFDYCVMIDLDLDFDFCERSFLSCGHYLSPCGGRVGAIGANGLNCGGLLDSLYYDTYSLSAKDTVFAFTHGFFNPLTGKCEKDLYKVESCFAGMVIYRYSEIYGRKYFLERNFISQYAALCEHKSLNKFIKGGVYINPRLVFYVRKNG